MLFYNLRRKRKKTGADENGVFFEIKIVNGEEVSEDTFLELSNGRGEDVEQQ